MRRFLTVVASVFVILAVLAPYAQAQPAAGPSPKVTINGVVDNITSWSKNMSLADVNTSRVDKEWYARTRARPDITAELGSTKFVLGLEIDLTYGQSGSAQDAGFRAGSEGLGLPLTTFGAHNGSSGGADLNTDVPGIIEIKWAYTEFALPWAPAGSIMRLGLQPFTITHKLSMLATGDFAGLHTSIALTPAIKLNFTYAQIEENFTGASDGFFRGKDFAMFVTADVSPLKGLDLKPIFSWAQFEGNTSSSSRLSKGGLAASSVQQGAFPNDGITGFTPGVSGLTVGTQNVAPNIARVAGLGTAVENRYTIGLDTKFTAGPFYLDPTVFYQWGQRQFIVPSTASIVTAGTCPNIAACTTTTVATGFARAGQLATQDMSAWLVDIRGGWRAGPLLVEAAAIYTTGNKATQDIRNNTQTLRYFQPISTDAQFYAGWAEIQAINIDYFNILQGADTTRGLSPSFGIGYDKYGLKRFGLRGSYALTPAFTVRTALTTTWTAEGVDTRGVKSGGAGVTPSGVGRAAHSGSDYYGTELDAGLTWRFAPGLTFDLAGGYMWTGNALSASLATASPGTQTVNVNGSTLSISRPDRDPKDVTTIAARVRYSF